MKYMTELFSIYDRKSIEKMNKQAEFTDDEEFCILEALGTQYRTAAEMVQHFPLLSGKNPQDIENWIETQAKDPYDEDNPTISNLRSNQQAVQVEYRYGQEERLPRPDWQEIRNQLKDMPSLTQKVYVMDGTPRQEEFEMNDICLHYQFDTKQVFEYVLEHVLKRQRCIIEDPSLFDTIKSKFKDKITVKAYEKAIDDFNYRINYIATTDYSDPNVPKSEADLISQQLSSIFNRLIQTLATPIPIKYPYLILYELSKIIFPDSSLSCIKELHDDFLNKYYHTAETVLKKYKTDYERNNQIHAFWNFFQNPFLPMISKVLPPDKIQNLKGVLMNTPIQTIPAVSQYNKS